MFLVFLIKIICILSFYFTFTTTVFTSIIHRQMLFVYFISLCCFSLSYYIRYNKKYSKFKYLIMLGIVLIAIYLRNIIGIISIPPFIYLMNIIKKDDYKVDYKDFKALFMGLIVAILALPVITSIIGDLEVFKRYSLPYALVFIVSGYYLLRTIRHSEKVINSRKFVIMNLMIIIVSFTICIILGSETVIKSIINVFDFVFIKGLFPLIIKIFSKIFNPDKNDLTVDEYYANLKKGLKAPEEELIKEIEETQFDYLQFSYILYPIVIAMIIFTTLVIITKVISKKKFIVKDTEVYGLKQYRSSLDDEISVDKKAKQILNGGVAQIRYWYKKFLMLCFKKNMCIFISDNSKTICEKSSKIFINSEQELKDMREVYCKARYSNENTNKQDIKTIKNICKNLEKKKYGKI